MTAETMSGGTDPNSVRKVMSVQAPPEIAWRVFTEKMGTRRDEMRRIFDAEGDWGRLLQAFAYAAAFQVGTA